MRVANEYLREDARAVASYTRIGGSEEVILTLEDVKASLTGEFAAVFPQIEAQIAGIQSETDAEALAEGIVQMDEQAGMMPPALNTAFKFMKQQMQKRIEEIESGAQSSTEEGGDE